MLAAVISGIAATASAQTPSTAPGQPPARTVTKDMPAPNAADAGKLIGRNIKNPANETIGEIKSVYITPDGKVDSVMVGVGGFLGVGEHYVAVSPSSVSIRHDAKNDKWLASMNTTKEALKEAPEFKYPK